jgi:hypothetical protein
MAHGRDPPYQPAQALHLVEGGIGAGHGILGIALPSFCDPSDFVVSAAALRIRRARLLYRRAERPSGDSGIVEQNATSAVPVQVREVVLVAHVSTPRLFRPS